MAPQICIQYYKIKHTLGNVHRL